MISKYREWIAANVKETYGRCREVTQAMLDAFPELTRVRGHYHCQFIGARTHWWLVAEDGSIVDPTAAQFPSAGMGEYIPLDESLPQPIGKCMNCGAYSYISDSWCSEECLQELEEEFNGIMRSVRGKG